jgi:sugar O-acyltransferase (sialic acid O-acetyltransferase NeuD family)
MTTKLLILGTRTLAVEIADVASEVPGIEVAGFVENMDRAKCTASLEGLTVYWVDEIPSLAATHSGVCALGTTRRSAFVEQAQSLGLRFTTIVHPSARISRNSTVGEGSIVCPGVIVATHTQIGRHVLLNRGALVGHHTRIGDYCSMMPGSNVAGACDIGERTFVGMGAIIIDHKKVGSNSLIAAGAVVAADVAERVQVAGVPARVVRTDIEGK